MAEELCKADQFEGEQLFVPGNVRIRAFGVHRTPGYHVRLAMIESSPPVFPPEFELLHTRPDGPVEPDESDFFASAKFASETRVDHVTVHDQRGANRVGIEHDDPAVRNSSCEG